MCAAHSFSYYSDRSNDRMTQRTITQLHQPWRRIENSSAIISCRLDVHLELRKTSCPSAAADHSLTSVEPASRLTYRLDSSGEPPVDTPSTKSRHQSSTVKLNVTMASGINIYSFFFIYPKKISGYPKKNLWHLKYWHINFRYLQKFRISEITISDI